MDIDFVEDLPHGSFHKPQKKTVPVIIDEAHPFDLESYIGNYSGRTAIDRLIHIVSTCPSIAYEAFQLALTYIYNARDPSLYNTLLTAYEQSCPDGRKPPTLNTKWSDEVIAKNQADRVKLEMELKNYTNNMIKESIRLAHKDLGDFYRSTGDYSSSLKHYTKSREYCTTSQHVLDMCLSVLELLIEQRNYAHLPTYVFKAEAALEAWAGSQVDPPLGGSSGKKSLFDRDRIQPKLDFATALSFLGQGNYEKAAYFFTRLGSANYLGDWIGKVVATSDIAVYGTICAISSLTRSAFKAQVQESITFAIYIEQESYVRELIEAYLGSNFKTVLDVLARYSTRHYVDIHLAPHVHELMALIRSKAVILYFQPFSSIKLERMSTAFGWTVEEVEQSVVSLIQSGDIQGRVDSQNKVLQVKKTDYRADLFARAIKTGNDMRAANRKLLLRMRLQQADLVIKPPRGHQPMVSDFLQE